MEQPSALSARTLTRLALALLLLGLAWRLVRYALRFPIWGDEGMLAVNIAAHGFAELTGRLGHCQIAPLLFVWGERLAYLVLGPDELALRLLPLLAGVGALALFWRLTGEVLEPLPRLFAVGFLAVAIWPVSMSTLIKPYSLDLCMSLALLVCASGWLKSKHPLWLAALAAAAPVALLASYPAAFVGAAVGLVLAWPAWKGGWASRAWFAVFTVALLGGFWASHAVGSAQLKTAAVVAGADTSTCMYAYWGNTFPPAGVLAFAWWLLMSLAGQMTAYPVGAVSGGSGLTLALCVVGAWVLGRGGRWGLLGLMAGPFVMTFVGAVMHRYPFGGSCRLAQHLAPCVCLLAGVGLAALIERARDAGRWTLIAAGVFALIGVGGMTLDVMYPYRDAYWAWVRSSLDEMTAMADAPVVVCRDKEDVEIVFRWRWEQRGGVAGWDYAVPAGCGDRLWGAYHGVDPDGACRRLEGELRRRDPRWRLTRRESWTFPARRKDPTWHCGMFCFERSGPPDRALTSS